MRKNWNICRGYIRVRWRGSEREGCKVGWRTSVGRLEDDPVLSLIRVVGVEVIHGNYEKVRGRKGGEVRTVVRVEGGEGGQLVRRGVGEDLKLALEVKPTLPCNIHHQVIDPSN